jgi:DNA-binding NarL/FixJ family response regulator
MTAPLIYNAKKIIYESSYLLFIDKTPVSEELKNYFDLFNIGIMEQKKITPISYKPEILTAILIHWSLLKNELQTIQQLYKTYSIPLLIISDYPNEDVCIKVLEAGADDFIIKPIHPKALHARINAINRRILSKSKQIKQEKEI